MYPIIVRLANVPGEIVTDAVNTQRGFSFKVLGVEGQKIAGHEGQTTQYFVLDSGTTNFPMPDTSAFLFQHKNLTEHAPSCQRRSRRPSLPWPGLPTTP